MKIQLKYLRCVKKVWCREPFVFVFDRPLTALHRNPENGLKALLKFF